MRMLHVIGSFLCIYLLYAHFARSFYYSFNFSFLSSNFRAVYFSGLLILLCCLLVSFLGYCLVWGQMSYWGVQVIINVLTVLAHPLDYLLPELIYSSSQLVLYRFFVLHFLLSLIIFFLILVHLYLLHTYTSSNTFLNLSSSLFISFYLFVFKDFYYYFIFYLALIVFIFFYNFEFLSNPVNLIPASSLSTPIHILPESYFLIYYSLLRALPSKLFGIIIVCVYMFYLLSPFTSASSSVAGLSFFASLSCHALALRYTAPLCIQYLYSLRFTICRTCSIYYLLLLRPHHRYLFTSPVATLFSYIWDCICLSCHISLPILPPYYPLLQASSYHPPCYHAYSLCFLPATISLPFP